MARKLTVVVLVGQLACQLAADEGVCPKFPYATTNRHTAAGTDYYSRTFAGHHIWDWQYTVDEGEFQAQAGLGEVEVQSFCDTFLLPTRSTHHQVVVVVFCFTHQAPRFWDV